MEGNDSDDQSPHLARRHRVRRRVAWSAVLVCLAVVVGAVTDHVLSASSADPGGRIMAKLAPVVRVVPGFDHGQNHWINSLPWPTPAIYAEKILQTQMDSFDGRPGTFGWDPITIQVGFPWRGTPEALEMLLNLRLQRLGWKRVSNTPCWVNFGRGPGWVFPAHGTATEVVSDPGWPEQGTDDYMLMIEAPPHGSESGGFCSWHASPG